MLPAWQQLGRPWSFHGVLVPEMRPPHCVGGDAFSSERAARPRKCTRLLPDGVAGLALAVVLAEVHAVQGGAGAVSRGVPAAVAADYAPLGEGGVVAAVGPRPGVDDARVGAATLAVLCAAAPAAALLDGDALTEGAGEEDAGVVGGAVGGPRPGAHRVGAGRRAAALAPRLRRLARIGRRRRGGGRGRGAVSGGGLSGRGGGLSRGGGGGSGRGSRISGRRGGLSGCRGGLGGRRRIGRRRLGGCCAVAPLVQSNKTAWV